MLFLYEKSKKIPYQFFFPAFEAHKSMKFQYRAGRENGDSRAVTSIQERISRVFSIPWRWGSFLRMTQFEQINKLPL